MRFVAFLFAALVLAGCPLPSLDSLEQADPSSCDLANPCVSGYHCLNGFCAKDGSTGNCSGLGGACDKTLGVCAGSTLQCVGATYQTTCDATSYGPDYEPVETKCDGLDNDCDGHADVGLTQACNNVGVCAGAKVACTGGTFPSCTAAVYTANNPSYEAHEVTCDGLDNDCDGLVDAWAPLNISSSPGVVSRNPAAAATSAGTLVLWEEGGKVTSRIVADDDTMSVGGAPSTTIVGASSSSLPAVASNGSLVAAAWGEIFGTTHRVALATLDPMTGKSTLPGGGALIVSTRDAGPDELAVAVTTTPPTILLALIEGGTGSVMVFTSDGGTPTLGPSYMVYFTGGRHLQVAAEASSFVVSWQDVATQSIEVHQLNPTGNTYPLDAGHIADFPAAVAKASSVKVYDVFDGGLEVTSCGLVTCSATTVVASANADLLRASISDFVAWEENMSSYRFADFDASDGGTILSAATPGRRPVPVTPVDASGTHQGVIVFDTNGASGTTLQADEIYLARYCL